MSRCHSKSAIPTSTEPDSVGQNAPRRRPYHTLKTGHGDSRMISYRCDHVHERLPVWCPRPTTTKSAVSSIAARRIPSGTAASRTRTETFTLESLRKKVCCSWVKFQAATLARSTQELICCSSLSKQRSRALGTGEAAGNTMPSPCRKILA